MGCAISTAARNLGYSHLTDHQILVLHESFSGNNVFISLLAESFFVSWYSLELSIRCTGDYHFGVKSNEGSSSHLKGEGSKIYICRRTVWHGQNSWRKLYIQSSSWDTNDWQQVVICITVRGVSGSFEGCSNWWSSLCQKVFKLVGTIPLDTCFNITWGDSFRRAFSRLS